ncbi:DNA processing protein DprA [Bifidobacterium goeldii]|uniref:DNA processing protein DprA n=1 Tax=Bifidobacterium goeldii TaxID=2306975 RepID=A0A430FMN8_9BIFI|nr:DNA-processing protein DprA [Bifidobacterium goeldii]RSX54117.1 DNA processing protein DprA [Bifidobacterium goeldii]
MVEPDDETVARATLTFCLDAANALMFALIKGCGSALAALQRIDDCAPHASARASTQAHTRIEHDFAVGIARWGRRLDARGMKVFHHELASWHQRLALLPSRNIRDLSDWFTVGGTQWIIAPHHPAWPQQLNDLSIRKDWATPLCLWGKGDPMALVSCAKPIAIVGSRGINDYGRYVAHTVAQHAAADGHLVISGGAMGADAAAHWGALSAADMLGSGHAGRTVAVFAGGLNHIGPQRNQDLFDRIEASRGALISELCPGTIPEARRFLLRNRIIAALSSTVVVAQARLRSGALSTANWAAELQREVYAAPGDINVPDNSGCNLLIHDNKAVILRSATHIDQLCHDPHQPTLAVQLVSNASAELTSQENPTQKGSSDNDVTTNNPPTHDTANQRAEITPDSTRQALLALIRRCKRKRLPTTPQSLADLLAQERTAVAQDAQTAADSLLAEVTAGLGLLELEGVIIMRNGSAVIASNPAGT